MEKISHLAIHPTHINIFYEFVGERKSTNQFIDFDQEGNPVYLSQKFLNSSRKANGEISDIARRKMTRAIDYLVLMAQEKKVKERLTGKTITFKVAFVTLTLPSKQVHTDGVIINKVGMFLRAIFNQDPGHREVHRKVAGKEPDEKICT